MPKGISTRPRPLRLNSIDYLRIRRPNQYEQNPCMTVMSGMLSCWASHGYNAEKCASFVTELRKCMDEPKSKDQKKNTINYHLMRMYPKVVGPRKKEGVLG